MAYLYETHLHTGPVSKCARASVTETLEFYKKAGYDGVFLTNHFIDGNINTANTNSYKEKLDFYFSDWHDAQRIGKELGIKTFLGVELSYGGCDFLIYGLPEKWYYDHPEIVDMPKKQELAMMMEDGALIIHAHPFREAAYIDHIRLFPRSVHGVEVINACRTDFENRMAGIYAESYQLRKTAGTDNHVAGNRTLYAGISTETPLTSEQDYRECILHGDFTIFTKSLSEMEKSFS